MRARVQSGLDHTLAESSARAVLTNVDFSLDRATLDRFIASALPRIAAVSALTQEALTAVALRARGRKEPVKLQGGRKDYVTREVAVHPTKGERERSFSTNRLATTEVEGELA